MATGRELPNKIQKEECIGNYFSKTQLLVVQMKAGNKRRPSGDRQEQPDQRCQRQQLERSTQPECWSGRLPEIFLLNLLGGFCGFYPSAEHAADFIQFFLERNIFFGVDGFDVFCQSDKNPQKVKLVTGF